MARESPAFGLSPTTLIALIVGAIGFFTINKITLQDTRPTEKPAPLYWHSPQEPQDIEARLWEDPLAAVARARRADPAHDKSERHTAEQLRATIRERSLASHILALGVFVSGAPYADDIEARRRARYAVLAGLHRAGFAPENAQHVGYFLVKDDSAEAPTVVVYESLAAEES